MSNGKGDRSRRILIPRDEWDQNWELIFKNKSKKTSNKKTPPKK